MPSNPVRIISAADASGPNTPVRISNWSHFIAAVITAIEAGELETLYALQAYIGDYTGGDYTHIQTDGTMRAYGDATCFRDELQSVTAARLNSPAGDFVENNPESSVTAKTSARYPTDYITTNLQLNHDWANGTVIFPHIHWWQTSAAVPNWLLAYRWQIQSGAKVTDWANLPWTQNVFTWEAGTLNQITRFGAITPPVGYGQVSDIVQIRLYRDVTNASLLFDGNDPVLANQDIVNLDTHLQVDMLGSAQEYIKY